MGDIVKELIEAIVQAMVETVFEKVARVIYGTKDMPRPVFWRALLRSIVLLGACAAILGLSGADPFDRLPGLLIFAWLPVWLCMLVGEQNFGHKKLLWTGAAAGIFVFAAALFAVL